MLLPTLWGIHLHFNIHIESISDTGKFLGVSQTYVVQQDRKYIQADIDALDYIDYLARSI